MFKYVVYIWVVLMLASCGGSSGGGDGSSSGDSGSGSGSVNTSYTLSGTITSAGGNVTDSDVNDPLAPRAKNDTYDIAQTIPNPVVLGGYLETTETPPYHVCDITDPVQDECDYFRVYLVAGQTISLVIADSDPIANDLDLYLHTEALPETIWTTYYSAGLGNTETLTLASDFVSGYYYINVYAYQGKSNYVLSIGQTAASRDSSLTTAKDDFIPGDIVVKFNEQAKGAPKQSAMALGMSVNRSTPGRSVLMKMPKDTAQRAQALATLGVKQKRLKDGSRIKVSFDQDKLDTLLAIHALNKRKDVAYAEPNYLRHISISPDDSMYSSQWHYPQINLPTAWDIETGSAAVVVAVVDTGVLLNHPDLQGQLVSGYDFVSNTAYALDGDGVDADPNDPGDRTSTGVNSSFHGTHVTGTIAAKSNNGTGVAGVAWNVKVMPVRALGKGGAGSSYDIRQAVLYAAGLPNDWGIVPSKPADIINLSLGGPSYSQDDQSVYDEVRAAGVIVIAAAGNNSTSSPSYPAAYSGVVSVSAVNQSKEPAYYSNYGSTISVAAPGGDTRYGSAGGIWSTMGNDQSYAPSDPNYYTYKAYQGTSMASPHMAGVVALMKSAYPALTPAQLDGLLSCGVLTEDRGAPGRDDRFGYGLIDATKAVNAALSLTSGASGCSLIQATPSQLNLGSAASSAQLELKNIGAGTTVVSSVVDDVAWLEVAPATVDANGLGIYDVTVDRSLIPADGLYRATITVTYAGTKSLTIPVSLQKISVSVEDDAGYLYVLLLDSDTLQSTNQVSLAAVNSRYDFVLDSVMAGSYFLIAGTDNNNNGNVCEPGEACGIYQLKNSSSALAVSGDLSSLNFVAGYNVFVAGPSGIAIYDGVRRGDPQRPRNQ